MHVIFKSYTSALLPLFAHLTVHASSAERLKPFLILFGLCWSWSGDFLSNTDLVMSSPESVGELSQSKPGQLNVCPCVDMGY